MNRLSARIALCASMTLAPGIAPCSPHPDDQGLSTEQRARLDIELERFQKSIDIAGMAIGIVDHGQPLYAGAFGLRDITKKAPVTTDTLFHIASISKTFTAVAILQLVEQQKLALGDPLEKYLPEFAGSGITIQQLMTHTAGLDDWIDPNGAIDDASVPLYVARVAKHRRDYPPGKGWEYCDADFNLLGAVIEKITGQTFGDYLTEYLFAPAGMTRTMAHLPDPGDDFAWPHRGEETPRRARKHPYDRAFVPSSGVESNVNDMMRWAIAILERSPALLAPSSFDAMFSRQVNTKWRGISMGLGWQLERHEGGDLPFHPGGDPGFKTLLTLYPHKQRAIVILSNGETVPRFEIRDAIEAFLAREVDR